MCKCTKETGQSCSCWKKWLFIGLGILAACGVAFWFWKSKKTA